MLGAWCVIGDVDGPGVPRADLGHPQWDAPTLGRGGRDLRLDALTNYSIYRVFLLNVLSIIAQCNE